MRPQVLVQNVFNISDLKVLAKMINQPETLFIQNTFKVATSQEAVKVHQIIVEAQSVLMSKFQIGDKVVEGSTYVDIVKGQVAQGFTQMAWLTT